MDKTRISIIDVLIIADNLGIENINVKRLLSFFTTTEQPKQEMEQEQQEEELPELPPPPTPPKKMYNSYKEARAAAKKGEDTLKDVDGKYYNE